jgi:butyrate kinase
MNLVNVNTSSVRKNILLDKLKDKALPLHDMKVLEGRGGIAPNLPSSTFMSFSGRALSFNLSRSG